CFSDCKLPLPGNLARTAPPSRSHSRARSRQARPQRIKLLISGSKYVGIECYRNATHTNNVRLFFLRSKELMMDTRHTQLSWLRVEVYVAYAVKESRHASLYPAPRN